jgi:hypothetical protein
MQEMLVFIYHHKVMEQENEIKIFKKKSNREKIARICMIERL